jgi:DNA-binding NtrC family response regulator
VAGGKLILIDPGLSTVDNLIAAGIPPSFLHTIIVTHNHWDCTRELSLVLMAASGPAPELTNGPNSSLRLFASHSVVHGLPMDVDAVLAHKSHFPDYASEEALRTGVQAFGFTQPAALNAFDIFGRLGGRVRCLDLGEEYDILGKECNKGSKVLLFTRPSYHRETYGASLIPGLDFVIQADEERKARIAYLSDTEYRPDLHKPYSEAVKDLGQIDVLIANVKTLSVFPYTEGSLEGYTRRQLGWKGVLQLTRDLRESGALSASSLVVLRAWGIETVTRLDKSGELVATPEKLEIYERVFPQETGQPALVPGRTWVGVSGVEDSSPSVYHLQRPFQTRGAGSRFGKLHFLSKLMKRVIEEAMAVMRTPNQAVFITGESGCGKDLLAQEIHEQASASGLREKNNIRIKDATELVDSLGNTQLYGIKRGSFTHATDKRGLLRQTENGTLVFDELHDMTLYHQGKFLTLLQERKYQPLGGDEVHNVTAQVIFTSSMDPKKSVDEGRIRPELLYRLREIHIPPLRERTEDIEAIVHGWHHEGELPEDALDKKIIRILEEYPWPGNVRRLKQALLMIKSTGDWSLDNVRKVATKVNTSDGGEQDQKPQDQQHENYLDPINREILAVLSPENAVGMRTIQRELVKDSKGGKRRGCSDAALVNRLNRLIECNLVVRVGGGPNTEYLLNAEEAARVVDVIPVRDPSPTPPKNGPGPRVVTA